MGLTCALTMIIGCLWGINPYKQPRVAIGRSQHVRNNKKTFFFFRRNVFQDVFNKSGSILTKQIIERQRPNVSYKDNLFKINCRMSFTLRTILQSELGRVYFTTNKCEQVIIQLRNNKLARNEQFTV